MNLREIDGVTWCPIDDVIPALDLLQTRLDQGCYLRKQEIGGFDEDGCVKMNWFLFDKMGEAVACGKDLRSLLVSLIFIEC